MGFIKIQKAVSCYPAEGKISVPKLMPSTLLGQKTNPKNRSVNGGHERGLTRFA